MTSTAPARATPEPLAAPTSGIKGSEVRIGVSGHLYVAPVGTTGPADTSTPWAAAWIDLGYLTDDGPTITPSLSSEDIKAWQSLLPVRKVLTERKLEWKFSLMQHNVNTLPLAFGGGTIAKSGTSPNWVYTYTPPPPELIDQRSFGLEVVDGTIIDRYVMKAGLVTDVGDIPFKRNEATRYELTVSMVADPAGGTPWSIVSNDPALDPGP